MEEPPWKPLSCAEKEKLKEKLAFLKREYTKTLARLQRAQRAEKVKSSSKKTVEPDCSLQRKISPQLDSAEPKKEGSPCGKVQISTHLDKETGEKTSVTLDREPGAFSYEDGLGEGLCLHRPGGTRERSPRKVPDPVGEERPPEPPGRHLQPRRTLTSQGREGCHEASSLMLSHERSRRQEAVSNKSPRLSAAAETHLSSPESEIPDFSAPVSEADGECESIPPTAKSERGVDVSSGGNSAFKEPAVPLHALSDSSKRQRLERMPPEGHYGLTSQGVKNIKPISPISLETQGTKMTVCTDSSVLDEAGSTRSQQPAGPNLESSCAGSVNELAQSSSAAGEIRAVNEDSHTEKSLTSPGDSLSSRSVNLEADELPSRPKNRSLQAVATVCAENPVHSCTVLEGLVFPAEYYVRTTRRMSREQRNAALQAVIQNHLGIKRKGFKNKVKEATKGIKLSNEETGESEVRMSASSPALPTSESPLEFISLPEVSSAPGPAGGEDYSRKAVSQPCNRKKRKSASPSALDHHKLLLPASGTFSASASEEEVTLHKHQDGKADTRGRRRGKEGRCQKEARPPAAHGASFASPLPKPEVLSQRLPLSFLSTTDFELPDADFGSLKLEKLKSCSEKPSKPLGSKMRRERHLKERNSAPQGLMPKRIGAVVQDLEEDLGVPEEAHPQMPDQQCQSTDKSLSSSILLFTSLNTSVPDSSDPPAAGLCSPAFPIVGPTPAWGSQADSGKLSAEGGQTCAGPQPSQMQCTAAVARDGELCGHLAGPSLLDATWQMADRQGQQACDSDSGLPAAPPPELFNARENEPCGSSCLALRECSPQQNPSGSCSVDVSVMWWEEAGLREPCVVTACEYVVSLWKHVDPCQWEKTQTWTFAEVPVLQIVPVPDVYNLVFVALGNLEIREIRALSCSSDDGGEKQQLLRSGTVRAVLGLPRRRLVSSGGGGGAGCDQQVEVVTLAEGAGGKEKQFLMSPEETILTFAELQGMQEALLGSTAGNSFVIWNLKTGQLLKKMSIDNSYQATVCHKAYSEMGLLFVVLSHPCAKQTESWGSPAFELVVINPKTTLSAGMMRYCLPPGQAGRFLEGDVKDHFAAAVLTSGTVAIWDLLLGHCTVLAPPSSNQSWSFVKWSGTDSHLLAGQKDGNIFIYRYS
ncbi:partner and localizer of BRCA2 isoform X2 [Octodon degus]|uniref:Partner and localizer of BRCA2 isoform X2 n=1 Tax=Octodon degus TaxID=10160 RepID=A0A6P6EEA6_OCTDE|nr:partner and localizer of BRCA2 isoform X2 [Octodon degus]